MINAISFKQGKIAFQVFLIVLCRWTSIACQLNLYDTDQRSQSSSLQSNCLNYRTRCETLAYQESVDVADDLIPYCYRPASDFHESVETFDDVLSQKLTFEELRMDNISSLQLLSWSMPIEVVERYQFYLNNPNSSANEQIYNCTPPRFGLQCQYSFEFGEGMSFNEMVRAIFQGRKSYDDSTDMAVEVPCYVLLKCLRGGKPWCLDWREVCDGNVDCFDEGLDEKFCFEMEINECHDDEFRCHNGLCISQELWENGLGDADCLDRSDMAIDISYTDYCFQDPTFRCEEHSCRTSANPFSCGDGQCVEKLQNCANGRHVSLIKWLTTKGDLTDECWMAMVCLTGLSKKVDGKSCNVWLMSDSTTYEALEQCEPVFQFPTVPSHSNHVRFVYKDLRLRPSIDPGLMPDYFCYDRDLCDSFIPDFAYENQPCLNATELILESVFSKNTWDELMWLVGEHFRLCSISNDAFRNETNYTESSSLYNCQNSLKWISVHRIMDGFYDCPEEDDEDNYRNSCQLNDRYRVTCLDETKCWSPLAKSVVCELDDDDNPETIRFQSFCDGITQYFYDNTGQNYSDEFGCENGFCNNMYTRCDSFWSCDDGRDEESCGRTICPSQKFACIDPTTYTVSCLNSSYVNNFRPDCLGELDEQIYCRSAFAPVRDTFYRFHCLEEGLCLSVSQLCNGEKDCADGSDEAEDFCQNQQFTCDDNPAYNRSEVEEVICELNEEGNRSTKYFSVHTSSNYPLLKESHVSEFTHRSQEQCSLENDKPFQSQNYSWPWYCNRGLVVHTWMKNNISNRVCHCSPSYYGHLCQYQNQRISITLRLTSNDRQATYAVVSMLIDDNDDRQEIQAYDQSVYIAKQSCSIKLNRYLLFPTQPKDISKNYSVRIDVFEKNTITYVGSWHFPIAFLFLPVNRLSVTLNLSNHLLHGSFDCPNKCFNGECMKYVNKAGYFCRCFPKWSGSECNTSIDCDTCSPDSSCIGSVNNSAICVCPIHKFGPRCLLTSECPIDACQNQGRCVPADVTVPDYSYTCLCSDRFFGHNCEHRKATLTVSLESMHIPAYLVAYFFTLSNQSEPIETTILRKLTLFQHIVTFHISVPFQLTFIQVHNKYYLALLQQSPKTDITTSISPKQECLPIEQLVNSSVVAMIEYRRIIHFHLLCQKNLTLTCFIDAAYLCLCTNNHQANCMKFNHQRHLTCPWSNYCANGGQCLQDHPTCPSTKICLCPNCFFGNQCQFYAKGLGSTLDEILGYEFKRNTVLFKQPSTVIIGAIVMMTISIIGIINSILSIIVFSRKKSQEVGCGIYLLGSSITSLFISILLTFKFCFLFYSHQDRHDQQRILQGNCFGIEPLLKLTLYSDTWLNACAAIERTVTVIQGLTFNRNHSKKVAKRICVALFVIIGCLLIPQVISLHIFYDETEERSWCVVKYAEWLATYTTALIFIHYFTPLAINILAIICIIVITIRRRARVKKNRSYWVHFRTGITKKKHLIMSSAIIVCLTLPHLIISLILDCRKSSHLFWFYQIGYFLSFLPATLIFLIFVLPVGLYRGEFQQLRTEIRRRYNRFRLNLSMW